MSWSWLQLKEASPPCSLSRFAKSHPQTRSWKPNAPRNSPTKSSIYAYLSYYCTPVI